MGATPLLLLVVAVASQPGLHILHAQPSLDGTVAVLSLDSIMYLRCGASILGASFTDPQYADQQPFQNFAVLQSAIEHLLPVGDHPLPRRVLALGLGVGAIPSYLRMRGWVADVVEHNAAVIKAAASHFGYNASSGALGRTLHSDAHELLMTFPEQRYDVVLHDLFSGASGVGLVSSALLQRVHDHWLEQGTGVLILQTIGYSRAGTSGEDDPFLVTLALWKRLKETFSTVRCFLEMHEHQLPYDHNQNRQQLSNMIFIASDREASLLRWDLSSRETELESAYLNAGLVWPMETRFGSDYSSLHWQEFAVEIEGAANELGESEMARLQRQVDSAMWLELVRPMLPKEGWGDDFERDST